MRERDGNGGGGGDNGGDGGGGFGGDHGVDNAIWWRRKTGMEKLSEGVTKVDDPRSLSMRNMRKESIRRRVQGVLGLMRGHLMLTLFIEIWKLGGGNWKLGGHGGLLALAQNCSAC